MLLCYCELIKVRILKNSHYPRFDYFTGLKGEFLPYKVTEKLPLARM